MRTLILVAALVALAVATGLSFVLPAAAQAAGPATLDVDCGEPIVVRPAVPTLLTCTAVAGNPGADTLKGARMEFVPARGLPPPDFYLFWSKTHDGVRTTPAPSDLTYEFGDIAPGGSSTIVLEVIVESRQGFGADVALVADPNQTEYGRTTVRGAAGTGAPDPLPITLARAAYPEEATPATTYRLTIKSRQAVPYDSVSVELAPGAGVVKSSGWTPSGMGRVSAEFGPLAADAEIERDITIVPPDQECLTVQAVVVVTVVEPGATRRQPAIGESVPVGACARLDGGGDVSLPQGGIGPAGGGRRGNLPAAAGVAAVGALCLGMGLTMRRRSHG